MGSKLLILAMLAVLGVAVAFMIYGWQLGAGANVSGFGYGAMAFGIVGTLIVGCGLMIAVFLSSRLGYDEQARDRDWEKRDDADGPPKSS